MSDARRRHRERERSRPADQHSMRGDDRRGLMRGPADRPQRSTANDWISDSVYPESTRWTAGLMSEDLPHVYAGRGPRNYRRSDERVREDVCDRLTLDPYVDASEIEVHVRDGEVVLSGSVTDRDQKYRAEDLVEGIRGVSDVANRLRVGHAAPADEGSGAGERRDDAVLQRGAAARVDI